METKVQKNTNETIPQWLFQGVEAFTHNGQKYLIIDGKNMLFHQAPGMYQQFFADCFIADKKAQRDLKLFWGITSFEEGFEKWFSCKFGGIDHIADTNNMLDLTPDIYNNTCAETNCPHRGRFCGKTSRLNSWDIQTIQVFGSGHTIQEAAKILCLSIAGVKSRINAIRDKTGARNMAQLISITAHKGV